MNIVDLLSELIAIPTQQSGPASSTDQIGDERVMCQYLAPKLAALGADQVHVVDAPRASGGPGAYVFATWGTPVTILNAHIDTVPANTGWTGDPWQARRVGDRVIGLGACDTKGAIAAALTAVAAMPNPARRNFGLLFSGDEERGTASVTAFLQRHANLAKRVIVCEPTARTAGIAHRGVWSYRASLSGAGGHSSKADFLAKPVATLARLAVALDDFALAHRHRGPAGMQGTCMNIAGITGGVAFNVVPTSADLLFSLRPAPGFDEASWQQWLADTCAAIDPGITVARTVDHAPFAALAPTTMQQWVAPYASSVGSLDFWTEAALWAAAGTDAVVLGPGSIAQAHTADEWVATDDLAWATAAYRGMLVD